ncbi:MULTISPECIES: phosphatase PAP2 family protein [Bradyrhizobium]|nr:MULTISPECIES: phosphatase PAP2 family protein [Bradyrhizobium]AJA61575.1 membrane protein [Bradyrhizobium japonicum]KGT75283.1 membrane protein [Bradyrhizobium japonicum]KMJ95127.1 membrane protein [Bradyrhizobium japonicum]MBR0764770.1 phosphatase PAP2 family protein [Bradyrhizobium japonicum]MCS3533293.1 undecaprenyl-diphosphatase [Bradyrhizobium japonicum]
MTIRVHPLPADTALARIIARNTRPLPEDVSSIITWGADGHVLTALAVGWWLWSRSKSPAQRRAGDHVLLTTFAAVLLPHLLKTQFDQVRPDRRTVRGHLHGIPLSGKALDAFPSGHAVHVGALASAATELRPAKRNLVWAIGAVLVSTRIVLLAHWASDVIAGLAIGAVLERLMRRLTGFGRSG